MTTPVPSLTMNDGRQIPQLGFGVWQVEPDTIVGTVLKAFEVGYRHLDTAAIYGNEEGVGRAIAESGLARDELFVTTKLWNSEHARERVVPAAEASLEKLGLDYVDLYLIHWPTPARDSYLDAWLGLEEVQQAGLARSIGVCNFQPDHLRLIVARATVVPAVNQIELHPTFTQKDLTAVNDELGLLTEAWSPLGLGEDLGNATISRLAAKHHRSPAQVIIRWHLQQGRILFPKSVTPSRIEENFDVFDFQLSDDDLKAIDGVDRGNRIGRDPDHVT